jgi:hypothetical protein
MSATALRWCAVPIGLLAFAFRIALTFWLEPFVWRMSLANALLVMTGGALTGLIVLIGTFAWLTRGDRGRPSRFVPGPGRFTVPASPVYAGYQAIGLMFISGGLVLTERVPGGDAMRMAQFDFAWPVSIIFVGFFWVAALAILLVQRPQLHLDAGGLTIRRVWRTTRLAWDELAPGGPPPPAKRRPRHMTIHLDAPAVFGRYPASEDVPVGGLHIDPTFLAGAIRHYVEHREDRCRIGTAEELTRLRSVLQSSTAAGVGTGRA